MIFFTLIFVCFGVFYWLNETRYKYWRKKGVTQKFSIPLLGDIDFFNGKPFTKVIPDIYNRFSNVRYTGLYQFHRKVLLIKDPELIKKLCIKDSDHFLDHKPFVPEEADPLWNKTLFSLRGQRWREMRATLSPSFTGSKMRMMFVLMQECAEKFVEHFSNNNENEVAQEIELKDTFTRFANDIIATTAFGIECNSLKDKENEFFINGRKATDFSGFWKNFKIMLLVIMPCLSKVIKGVMFNQELTNFFRRLTEETVEYREKNNINRPDMLNLLMHARKGLQKEEDEVKTEDHQFSAVEDQSSFVGFEIKGKYDFTMDDITSQAVGFFFAGFDTVSTAMCFLAYELALNRDIQDKLIEELDKFRNGKEKLTYEALSKLQYFDMVFTETLRKWPPVITIDRVCVKPYTIEPGLPNEIPVKIEVDDTIWIPIWALHRDPKYWPNPEKFDPERFSSENKIDLIPDTYYPFGIGPRNCLGSRFAILEVKILLFEILGKYEIVPCSKTVPFVQNKRSFTLSAKDGFWFRLKKRKLV